MIKFLLDTLEVTIIEILNDAIYEVLCKFLPKALATKVANKISKGIYDRVRAKLLSLSVEPLRKFLIYFLRKYVKNLINRFF